MEGAFRSGAPWPVALRTRRCQSISPLASARAVKGTSTNKASVTQRATGTLLRASGMSCLALLLHQRLDGLADALAEDEHLAHVGRRLLLVAIVQVEQVGDALAVQDGHDQRRERHLLAQLREEPDVERRLLQRPEEVAARLHHQLERARRRERDGDDLRRLLEAVAQPVPAERHAALDKQEQRALRLASRRAQHD